MRQLLSSLTWLASDTQGILLQHIQPTMVYIWVHGLQHGKALEGLWNCWICVDVHRYIFLGREFSSFNKFTLFSSPPLVLFIYSFKSESWSHCLLHKGNHFMVKVCESLSFCLAVFLWCSRVYKVHKLCVLSVVLASMCTLIHVSNLWRPFSLIPQEWTPRRLLTLLGHQQSCPEHSHMCLLWTMKTREVHPELELLGYGGAYPSLD